IKTAGEGQRDVGLLVSERPCVVAGVFTQNKFRAAPVHWCQERVASRRAQAIVVNSGNANAGTGDQGYQDTAQMAVVAAEHLGLDRHDVLVASTGVIGVPMPMEKVRQGIVSVHPTREGASQFVRAMMTTDTFPKTIAAPVTLRNGRGVIGGAAKGAGMIHPNMATLLSFITTDLAVEPHLLQQALKAAADASFNMITIDGDTSTNDTLLLLANGAAGAPEIREGTPDAHTFQESLNALCIHLAKMVARDGEGATKLIEVRAEGAQTLADARAAARTVAASSLFKAAVYGRDPNWGRILSAAGRSGAELDPARADVFVGDICLMRSGQPQPFDRAAARAAMSGDEVDFRIDLNLGQFQATAWGCDLTEEYVRFNAEYTT
ncbi:MAG: bifunctional glutamate N-acetyltransferase/amino-acid acetyltransferase ArgJ, partial [Chloroflexota bacterium]